MCRLIRMFFSISILIVLSGCSMYKTLGKQIENTNPYYVSPYFNQEQKDYLFDAKINAYNHQLSGILAIKRIDSTNIRCALLSNFGNTIFDFSFYKEKYKVNYIMDALNRKIIIHKLTQYLQMFLKSKFKIKRTYLDDDQTIYISKLKGKSIFLYINKNNQLTKLEEINSFGKRKTRIRYYLDNKKLDSIHYQSKSFKMQLIRR